MRGIAASINPNRYNLSEGEACGRPCLRRKNNSKSKSKSESKSKGGSVLGRFEVGMVFGLTSIALRKSIKMNTISE